MVNIINDSYHLVYWGGGGCIYERSCQKYLDLRKVAFFFVKHNRRNGRKTFIYRKKVFNHLRGGFRCMYMHDGIGVDVSIVRVFSLD